jgi:hypothetical protein
LLESCYPDGEPRVVTLRDGGPFSVTAAVPNALSALAVRSRSPNQDPYLQATRAGLARPLFRAFVLYGPGARELGKVGRTRFGPGVATWDPTLFNAARRLRKCRVYPISYI